jgi:hypothetical protein
METIGDSPVNSRQTRTRHPGGCTADLDNVGMTEGLDNRRKRWIRVGCEEREREDD